MGVEVSTKLSATELSAEMKIREEGVDEPREGAEFVALEAWELCETRRVGKTTPNRHKILTLNVNNYIYKH